MGHNRTIGSQGLEQGGANLGNDHTRPTPHMEQNETTNVGSHPNTDNDNDLLNVQKAEYGESPNIEQNIQTPRKDN